MPAKTLTIKQRKQIFQTLVETQDKGVSVPESKKQVAAQYHITKEQLELIEKEGLEKDWPPLT